MIEENMNGTISEGSSQVSETPAKDEPGNNQRHGNARPHTQSWYYRWFMEEQGAILDNLEQRLTLMRRSKKPEKP